MAQIKRYKMCLKKKQRKVAKSWSGDDWVVCFFMNSNETINKNPLSELVEITLFLNLLSCIMKITAIKNCCH